MRQTRRTVAAGVGLVIAGGNTLSGRATQKQAAPRRVARGLAAVELAVCLPVIVVLVFAAIESCSMIFITQALHAATYEGVRVAVNPTATNSAVTARTQGILDGHGIAGATITLDPSDIATAASGTLIRVRVTAGCDANRISPPFFFGGRNIEVQTTMVKE